MAPKLYDIVAGFQDGSEDTSIYVQRIIQAIVISQEKNKKHSEFYVSVLSSAFTNYCQYYQDLLNEEYFEVMKKQPMSIPLAQMTSLGCDAFIKVNSKLFVSKSNQPSLFCVCYFHKTSLGVNKSTLFMLYFDSKFRAY